MGVSDFKFVKTFIAGDYGADQNRPNKKRISLAEPELIKWGIVIIACTFFGPSLDYGLLALSC